MRTLSGANCNSVSVTLSTYLSVTLSLSITFFPEKKKDKAYLQFDLQISVDLRTDNEIKKMILIKKIFFFFSDHALPL